MFWVDSEQIACGVYSNHPALDWYFSDRLLVMTAWFKFRTGDEDPTLPVLPEYICTKIQALS